MRPGICARTTHTLVLNGTVQSIHRFYGTLCAARNTRISSTNGSFCVYFWKILKVWICKIIMYEGWSIIQWCMNGVKECNWGHKCRLYPHRGASSGINKTCFYALDYIHEPLKLRLLQFATSSCSLLFNFYSLCIVHHHDQFVSFVSLNKKIIRTLRIDLNGLSLCLCCP